MLAISPSFCANHRRTHSIARRLLSPIVTFAMILLLLSLADAVATLRLLDAGGEELNPAMRWLLGRGSEAFLAGKMGLTASGAFILLAFRNHRLLVPGLRVRSALPALTGLYACLNVYQVALLLAP